MGKPDRKPKEPEEDLDIKATLHKLLQNTKGIPEMNAEVTGLKTQLKRTNDVLIPGLQTQIAALKTDVKEMSGDIEVQDTRLKDLEDRFDTTLTTTYYLMGYILQMAPSDTGLDH